MIVIQSTKNHYCFTLTASDLFALQYDVDDPPDWYVKDVPTLLAYILETHLEEIKTRHDL